MLGKMLETRKLRSFADIGEETWKNMKRPFIPVYDLGPDIFDPGNTKYVAMIYDGADCTGYYRVARDVQELFSDIEERFPGLEKYPPGEEDVEILMCVYA